MSEEEKKEKKEEAKVEKPEAKAEEAPAHEQHPKHTKLNHLDLQGVERELKTVKEKMGGFHSKYAQHLLLRKKELTGSK